MQGLQQIVGLVLATAVTFAAAASAADQHASLITSTVELASASEPALTQDQHPVVSNPDRVADDSESPEPALPAEIPLRVTGAPVAGDVAAESPSHLGGQLQIHNVSQPTLTPFLPPATIATGTAIIIAPGGSFIALSIDNEGYKVARWLASKGIAAFVLKYRLMPSAPSAVGLTVDMLKMLKLSSEQQKAHVRRGVSLASPDAAEALRVVRSRAREWGIDPKRVGLMGFSAGAMIAIDQALKADDVSRPDFIVPIYGLIATPDHTVPKKLPPMWTALASDDPLVGKTDFGLITAWRKAGAEVELHYFEKGGHGFGFDGKEGTTTVHWPDELFWWLQSQSLLGKKRD